MKYRMEWYMPSGCLLGKSYHNWFIAAYIAAIKKCVLWGENSTRIIDTKNHIVYDMRE